MGQGPIPLLQPGAGKMEGLEQFQTWGARHHLGEHGPAEIGARLGQGLVWGQDGLGVVDIRPTTASVEQGLKFPTANEEPWDLHRMDSPRGQAGTSPRGTPQAWATLLKFP